VAFEPSSVAMIFVNGFVGDEFETPVNYNKTFMGHRKWDSAPLFGNM